MNKTESESIIESNRYEKYEENTEEEYYRVIKLSSFVDTDNTDELV